MGNSDTIIALIVRNTIEYIKKGKIYEKEIFEKNSI